MVMLRWSGSRPYGSSAGGGFELSLSSDIGTPWYDMMVCGLTTGAEWTRSCSLLRILILEVRCQLLSL